MDDYNGRKGPTAAQRRAWGRRGALLVHGNGRTNVGPAHAALAAKWEHLADPDGTLTPEVRERLAKQLRTAHMIDLSLRAAAARQRKRVNPDRTGLTLREVRRAAHGERPTAA